MIRKLMIAAIACGLAVSTSFGAAKPLAITSWLKPGNFMMEVGAHYSYFGFGVGGGVEFVFAEWRIADVVPLQFGITARGYADFVPWWAWGSSFGVGGLATVHFSIKSLKLGITFVDNLDFYIGLGVGFNIVPGWNTTYLWYWNPTGIGFWSSDGVNYFITENLAIFAEYNYYGGNSGGSLGLLLKI
ncbi:MAG: hypothetical protein AABZ39_05830 [Spirochaetota bacterium]